MGLLFICPTMTRIDETRFAGDHYLGRPADAQDKIISRRVELVRRIPGFCGKDLTLLEIGCGNGATMLLLHDCMKHCHGVDIFDHTTDFAQQVNERQITNCTMQQADIECEELQGQYDRLICFEVIEHLRNHHHVARFRKWLRPGALCAISVPNKWWIFETHGAKLPLLPWNRVPFFSWLPTCIHERYANARIYTRRRIKRLLEECGFEVVDMQYITAPMDVLKEGPLKRFLVKYIFRHHTTRIPFLSTSIFIVAKNKPS
ncbi:MAG: class I SAM-dependent methyltransferase [Chitinophagales bacterium]|nr:class I SAM-dependent methyltransferase [Chitinophagales bacterium]MDW8418142.1 class I SAM-dependent methyltransferase [Chitinophagales bacterium]